MHAPPTIRPPPTIALTCACAPPLPSPLSAGCAALLELLEEDAFTSAASDDPPLKNTVADFAHLTVPQLKVELRRLGRPVAGPKASLLRRLTEAINEERVAGRGRSHQRRGGGEDALPPGPTQQQQQ